LTTSAFLRPRCRKRPQPGESLPVRLPVPVPHLARVDARSTAAPVGSAGLPRATSARTRAAVGKGGTANGGRGERRGGGGRAEGVGSAVPRCHPIIDAGGKVKCRPYGFAGKCGGGTPCRVARPESVGSGRALQPLGEDHHVVAVGVEVPYHRGLVVPVFEVEP